MRFLYMDNSDVDGGVTAGLTEHYQLALRAIIG